MRTISQRELRNDNADIVRAVEAGESYTITRHGVPVARLVPLSAESDLHCDRPARSRIRYADLERVKVVTDTSTLLAELRDER